MSPAAPAPVLDAPLDAPLGAAPVDAPSGLRVALVGCGAIAAKRAAALRPRDRLVACYDVRPEAARALAARHPCAVCASLEELLALRPEVVIVATVHDRLAELAAAALAAGAHVLVEKPAGVSRAEIERLLAAERASGRRVKVGFNHRFHPGIARAVAEVHSGRYGELLHLRGRYGHGGRPGYEREWRCQPARSGGGELVDQGMHLLDLSNWLAGPLPLHAALLRTQFWEAPVEDNAALILGAPQPRPPQPRPSQPGASRPGGPRAAPWALLHVGWTEWKNLFSLEIFCRRAKLQVDGLARSYGPQRLRIYRMPPTLGPPALEELHYPDEDRSWEAEWEHFAAALAAGDGRELCGDLRAAHAAWTQVEAAYAAAGAAAAGAAGVAPPRGEPAPGVAPPRDESAPDVAPPPSQAPSPTQATPSSSPPPTPTVESLR